jgi:hypothetical protein
MCVTQFRYAAHREIEAVIEAAMANNSLDLPQKMAAAKLAGDRAEAKFNAMLEAIYERDRATLS